MFGIVTIAIGEKSLQENNKCKETYKRYLPDIPFITLDQCPMDGYSDKQKSRFLKTRIPLFLPSNWTQFLYVDSDTRLLSSDIMTVKEPLENGFDMVMVPSMSQSFWHIEQNEIDYSIDVLEYYPMQYQCGVMACNLNNKTKDFFMSWFYEWVKFNDNDQMAFLRALHKNPLKIWLMGYPFNSDSGSIVQHLFGVTREKV